jgi:hypothetical protein
LLLLLCMLSTWLNPFYTGWLHDLNFEQSRAFNNTYWNHAYFGYHYELLGIAMTYSSGQAQDRIYLGILTHWLVRALLIDFSVCYQPTWPTYRPFTPSFLSEKWSAWSWGNRTEWRVTKRLVLSSMVYQEALTKNMWIYKRAPVFLLGWIAWGKLSNGKNHWIFAFFAMRPKNKLYGIQLLQNALLRLFYLNFLLAL